MTRTPAICRDCNYRVKPGANCWHVGHLGITIRVLMFLFGCENYSPWWKHSIREPEIRGQE